MIIFYTRAVNVRANSISNLFQHRRGELCEQAQAVLYYVLHDGDIQLPVVVDQHVSKACHPARVMGHSADKPRPRRQKEALPALLGNSGFKRFYHKEPKSQAARASGKCLSRTAAIFSSTNFTSGA